MQQVSSVAKHFGGTYLLLLITSLFVFFFVLCVYSNYSFIRFMLFLEIHAVGAHLARPDG